jgi:hypothetical protein
LKFDSLTNFNIFQNVEKFFPFAVDLTVSMTTM